MNVALVDGIASGELKFPNASSSDSALLRSRPFLNRTETADELADFARASFRSLDLHYADMSESSAAVLIAQAQVSTPKLLLSGNFSGKILQGMLLPAHRSLVSFKCDENSRISAIQALIALRRFKENYGTLPETLNALVPEYLPSLPIDDFDGKPIRYSVEKKVVYSIGKDMEDAGGVEKLDLVFPIRF